MLGIVMVNKAEVHDHRYAELRYVFRGARMGWPSEHQQSIESSCSAEDHTCSVGASGLHMALGCTALPIVVAERSGHPEVLESTARTLGTLMEHSQLAGHRIRRIHRHRQQEHRTSA